MLSRNRSQQYRLKDGPLTTRTAGKSLESRYQIFYLMFMIAACVCGHTAPLRIATMYYLVFLCINPSHVLIISPSVQKFTQIPERIYIFWWYFAIEFEQFRALEICHFPRNLRREVCSRYYLALLLVWFPYCFLPLGNVSADY